MPPDSCLGKAWANAVSPTLASAARTASARSDGGQSQAPSATLSATFSQGMRRGSWNATLTSRLGPPTVRPSTAMLPRVGVSSPASRRSNVLLPQPLGPMTVTTCSAPIDRSNGPSAVKLPKLLTSR